MPRSVAKALYEEEVRMQSVLDIEIKKKIDIPKPIPVYRISLVLSSNEYKRMLPLIGTYSSEIKLLQPEYYGDKLIITLEASPELLSEVIKIHGSKEIMNIANPNCN